MSELILVVAVGASAFTGCMMGAMLGLYLGTRLMVTVVKDAFKE